MFGKSLFFLTNLIPVKGIIIIIWVVYSFISESSKKKKKQL